MQSLELGIIGAGNMAEAIARGLLAANRFTPQQMIVADVSAPRRDIFHSQLKITATEDNHAVAAQSRRVLLCVKPQQMGTVLADLKGAANPRSLFISIAAAITTPFIERTLGDTAPWRVVRAMPNTPMLLGAGACAICPGAHATAADLNDARGIFESAAIVVEVTENQMDAVTALSGSGPAYFFYLTEQLVKAGVELGLSPEHARLLAQQTALGAAKMLTESSDDAAELRQKVTSPGGTTEAAIAKLMAAGWPTAMLEAIKAAAARSKELSR